MSMVSVWRKCSSPVRSTNIELSINQCIYVFIVDGYYYCSRCFRPWIVSNRIHVLHIKYFMSQLVCFVRRYEMSRVDTMKISVSLIISFKKILSQTMNWSWNADDACSYVRTSDDVKLGLRFGCIIQEYIDYLLIVYFMKSNYFQQYPYRLYLLGMLKFVIMASKCVWITARLQLHTYTIVCFHLYQCCDCCQCIETYEL